MVTFFYLKVSGHYVMQICEVCKWKYRSSNSFNHIFKPTKRFIKPHWGCTRTLFQTLDDIIFTSSSMLQTDWCPATTLLSPILYFKISASKMEGIIEGTSFEILTSWASSTFSKVNISHSTRLTVGNTQDCTGSIKSADCSGSHGDTPPVICLPLKRRTLFLRWIICFWHHSCCLLPFCGCYYSIYP